MAEEENALHAALTHAEHTTFMHGGSLAVQTRKYVLGARSIYVARSGIGPVNAAVALLAVAQAAPIDGVILLGVGGSISPALHIGDVVVSTRVLQHDSYSSLDFGDPRMAPGDYILSPEQADAHVAHFEADALLVELVSQHGASHRGTVLSGNEFVGTLTRKLALQQIDSDALLVEMEGAGVAQSAKRLNLPFVIVKTVADRLHADGSIEQDFRACLHAAAENAARVLRRCLMP